MINDFINLLFPKVCFACSTPLLRSEKIICLSCRFSLPKTGFHTTENSAIDKVFYGRVKIEKAAAYYYFNKGSKVQKLIHQFKYKGGKEIGEYIGELYGAELKNSLWYNNIDYIIPIPLHPKKKKKRGYNQSDYFAKGLAKSLNTTALTNNLIRHVNTKTQTKKTRFKRWENVDEIFGIRNKNVLKNKTILLVDDVVTTGATLEAAAQLLLKNEVNKILISTMAIA